MSTTIMPNVVVTSKISIGPTAELSIPVAPEHDEKENILPEADSPADVPLRSVTVSNGVLSSIDF